MWCLGSRLSPTIIASSASDYSGRGAAFVKPEKGCPEVSCCPLRMLKSLYPSEYVDALTYDIWGLECPLQLSPQAHQIISNFAGRGAAFVKPGKGHSEVSCCPLRMLKISVFVHCIYLTMLVHLYVMSGVWNASYSHRLKRIRSFQIFLGGELHFWTWKGLPWG